MAEKKIEQKHVKNIIHNYEHWEEEIATQLQYECDIHGSTAGGSREEVWRSLFMRIVPKKFQIARSVFIIDSEGNCSKEVDLAIYDEQYTPYIFQYGVMKFIPIEAVAAVVECKSSRPSPAAVTDWLTAIEKLETSQESIVRIVGHIHYGSDKVIEKTRLNTQTKTRPIKILCYISENEKNEPLEKFDIIMTVRKKREKNRLDIQYGNYENLFQWYLTLNQAGLTEENFWAQIKGRIEEEEMKMLQKYHWDVELKKKKVSNAEKEFVIHRKNEKINLLSFVFEFNQLLMLINNPIFFPHRAYVEMFNKYLAEGDH